MLIKVHCDESSDKHKEYILSIGAVMSFVDDENIVGISDGERAWQQRLNHDGIAYFHASDCESLKGEFDLQKLGGLSSARAIIDSLGCDLRGIIKQFNFLGIGASILISDFNKVINQYPQAREYYGSDPKVAVCKTLIKATIEWLNKDRPDLSHLPVSFLFDDYSGYLEAEKAYVELRGTALYGDRLGTIGHGDDKKIPALQMGDLMAYEARYETLRHLKEKDTERYMFNKLWQNNSVYSFILMNESGMLRELGIK